MNQQLRNFWQYVKRLLQVIVWYLQGKPTPPDWQVEHSGPSTIYTGFFSVYERGGIPRLTLQGRIVEWPGLPTDVYVYDPPLKLRQHKHGSCLQLLRPGDAWFKLHWQKPARTFTQSCAYIEQLLAEIQ
jgi:hypothetical protein